MADLLVYAVGDSVMWGEGLAEENKFAFRAAASLAKARDLKPNLKLLAHCGATIKQDFKKRQAFVNKFPHLFRNEKEKTDFLAESGLRPDERPADRLHGEIARAFPTIPHQIRSIPGEEAAHVNLLLVTGGANDIDFETLFTTEGNFLEKLDDDFRRIFHDDIIDLLSLARGKCPNALIILTGYYSAFSQSSSFDAMKNFVLEVKEKKEAYKFLSTAAVVAPVVGLLVLPPEFSILVGLGVNIFKDSKDDEIEAGIALARAVSETSESRTHYWMRRAVAEINEDPSMAEIRGPGLVFADPGFLPENCVFAPDSLIWQQYEESKLLDPQAERRALECPRNDLRTVMRDCSSDLAAVIREAVRLSLDQKSHSEIQRVYIEAAKQRKDNLAKLRDKLEGPRELREALKELIESTPNAVPSDSIAATVGHQRRYQEVIDQISDEVGRIDITRISSFIHPDPKGAARYATVVHQRAEELRQISVRERLVAFLPPKQRKAPPAVLDVGKMIRRFGFDPAVGVRACLAHAEPDVLSLVVHTHKDSNPLSQAIIGDPLTGDTFIPPKVFLNLGEARRWHLRHLLGRNPHLRPDTRDFFTIDVAGQIQIGDITEAAVEFDGDLLDKRWRPKRLILSIDGCDVFEQSFDSPPEVSRRLSWDFPKR